MSIPQVAFFTAPLVGALLLPPFLEGVQGQLAFTYFGLLAIETTVLLLWRLIIRPNLFSSLRDLPEPPGWHFLAGHFRTILSSGNGEAELKWLQEIPNDGMLRTRDLFNVDRLVVTTPKALEQVATDSFGWHKPEFVSWLAARVLGMGLVLTERDVHRQQRKLFMPPFAPKHIRDLIPTFWRKSREVTQKMCEDLGLDGQGVFEIGDWAARVGLDIIGCAAMGQDFGAVQNADAPLAKVYMKVLEPTLGHIVVAILKGWFPARVVEMLPIKSNHDQAEAYSEIRRVCLDLLRGKKARIAEGKEDPGKDILSVCLKYEDTAGADEEEVLQQMTTFLAAGHETTSVGITWAVYMLILHKDWQKRLREEIRAVMPALDNEDLEASHEQLENLPLLRAFVEEVIRWYPPIPTTMREPYADTVLDGRVVKKGTRVVIPIKAINRSPHFWGPDAGTFNPSRWLKDENKTFNPSGGVSSKFGHVTFWQGPRQCIAQGFARTEMLCVLATFIGRFEFLETEDKRMMDEGNMVTSNGNLSAKPLHGMRVRVKVLDGW